jgi:hypothetical protein
MKKNLVLLSLVSVLTLTACFVYAGSGVAMRINVPFDFYIENQLFPAGEYRFEMDSPNSVASSHVTVWATKGQEVKMLATIPEIDANATVNALRFNKYEDSYFLSTISISGHKATLREYKMEEELRSQLEKAQNTTIVAQK